MPNEFKIEIGISDNKCLYDMEENKVSTSYENSSVLTCEYIISLLLLLLLLSYRASMEQKIFS